MQMNIPGLARKSDVGQVMDLQLTLARLNAAYKGFISVFTDGSCAEKGPSLAFVILSLETQQSFKLGNRTSSMASELNAIPSGTILSAIAYIGTTRHVNK